MRVLLTVRIPHDTFNEYVRQGNVGDVIREFSGYVADAREGSKDRVANHSKLLWGFIRRKAEQNDVDLTPNPA